MLTVEGHLVFFPPFNDHAPFIETMNHRAGSDHHKIRAQLGLIHIRIVQRPPWQATVDYGSQLFLPFIDFVNMHSDDVQVRSHEAVVVHRIFYVSTKIVVRERLARAVADQA